MGVQRLLNFGGGGRLSATDVLIFCAVAVLFSVPDARLFGVTSSTAAFALLFGCLPRLYFSGAMSRAGSVNAPFFLLLFFGIIGLLFTAFDGTGEDAYFVFNKVKDLLTEILIAVSIVYYSIKRKLGLSAIFRFVEIFFILNITYYVVREAGLDLSPIFHQSIEDLDRFSVGREPFLGWEPSYTGPVAFILGLYYIFVSDCRWKVFLVASMALFIVWMSDSKTIYLLIGGCAVYFFWTLLRYFFVLQFAALLFVLFFVGGFFSVEYFLTDVVGFRLSFDLASLDPIQFGSFITRSETIDAALQLFFVNPLGYGYGSSVLTLSDSIEGNVGQLISSEHLFSGRYAKTPKSQFLEYAISGGIFFIFLFVKALVYLWRKIECSNLSSEIGLKAVLVASIVGIVFGERLPFVLIVNLVNLVAIVKAQEMRATSS